MQNRLIEILKKKPPHTNFSPQIAIQNDADYLLKNDVVAVVKCHKCKHWCELNMDGWCENEGKSVERNDFCSHGEPKTSGRKRSNTPKLVTFEKWETRSSSTDLFYGIMNKDIGIVGTFGVSVYDEGLGVGSFEILEPYQNKGFGTAAIKRIVKMFSNDFDLIYCYVDSWNESAIRFYERLGKVHKNRLNESCQYYVELYKKEGGVR